VKHLCEVLMPYIELDVGLMVLELFSLFCLVFTLPLRSNLRCGLAQY
jgi:hypothetical protein